MLLLLPGVNGRSNYELPEPIVNKLEGGVRRRLLHVKCGQQQDMMLTLAFLCTTTLTHVDEQLAKERGASSGASSVKADFVAMMHEFCYYSIIRKYVMQWTYGIPNAHEQIMATILVIPFCLFLF